MKKHLKNQSGFALVSALLVIIILTLISTVAMMTANNETDISLSYRESQETFYAADGAARMGVSWLKEIYNVSHRPTTPGTGTGKTHTGKVKYAYNVSPPSGSSGNSEQETVGFSARQETRYKSSSRMFVYNYKIDATATSQRGKKTTIKTVASYLSDN